jgi:hypothetical protein
MRKVLGKPEHHSDYLKTYDRRLPPLHNSQLGAFALIGDKSMADHSLILAHIKELETPEVLAVEFFPSLRVLEVTFQSTEIRDNMVQQHPNYVIPHSAPPSLTTYHVKRVPPGPCAQRAAELSQIFGKWGTVHEIHPKVWEGTTVVTHSWQVILERSSKVLVPCTTPFFGIGKPGNDIIIKR